jgi:hypothetical protein
LFAVGAVGDPSQQFHDWEPGIKPSGLFWTVPFPPEAMSAAPDAGRARLRARAMAIPDFHDFLNSISPRPDPRPRPSHVTFDVEWHGGGARRTVRDRVFDFGGHFVDGPANIRFTAADDHEPVVYTSVAEGQTTVYAGVGRERNGVFFG